MNDCRFLEVNDVNINALLAAERAVLILTKSTCGNCARYQQEIVELENEGRLAGIVIGKMILDKPGNARFKRDNPWLSQVPYLPYTLLFRHGRQVDAFAASKASYLAERVEDCLCSLEKTIKKHSPTATHSAVPEPPVEKLADP